MSRLEAERARIAADPFASALGIAILALEEGYCRAALTVGEGMRNFLGMAHGAAIYAVADVAFSGAANAREPSTGIATTINFLAGAQAGDRLIAEARELRRGRQLGFYRVTVATEGGTLIASMEAVSYRLERGGGGTPADPA